MCGSLDGLGGDLVGQGGQVVGLAGLEGVAEVADALGEGAEAGEVPEVPLGENELADEHGAVHGFVAVLAGEGRGRGDVLFGAIDARFLGALGEVEVLVMLFVAGAGHEFSISWSRERSIAERGEECKETTSGFSAEGSKVT